MRGHTAKPTIKPWLSAVRDEPESLPGELALLGVAKAADGGGPAARTVAAWLAPPPDTAEPKATNAAPNDGLKPPPPLAIPAPEDALTAVQTQRLAFRAATAGSASASTAALPPLPHTTTETTTVVVTVTFAVAGPSRRRPRRALSLLPPPTALAFAGPASSAQLPLTTFAASLAPRATGAAPGSVEIAATSCTDESGTPAVHATPRRRRSADCSCDAAAGVRPLPPSTAMLRLTRTTGQVDEDAEALVDTVDDAEGGGEPVPTSEGAAAEGASDLVGLAPSAAADAGGRAVPGVFVAVGSAERVRVGDSACVDDTDGGCVVDGDACCVAVAPWVPVEVGVREDDCACVDDAVTDPVLDGNPLGVTATEGLDDWETELELTCEGFEVPDVFWLDWLDVPVPL